MPEQPKVIEVDQPDKCWDVALDTSWCARTQAYCHSHRGKYCYSSRLETARLFARYGGYEVKAKE